MNKQEAYIILLDIFEQLNTYSVLEPKTTPHDPFGPIEYYNERNEIRSEEIEHLKQFIKRAIKAIRAISEDMEDTINNLNAIHLERVDGEDFPDNIQEEIYQYEMLTRAQNNAIRILQDTIDDIKLSNIAGIVSDTRESQRNSKKVFVVHGHDNAMRETVCRFLEKLGLEPIVLHERASKGNTIIEKIEEYRDVGFAVVLLSPDDEGYSRSNPGIKKSRARQNVIFELGYFIGLLGRSNVVALFRPEENFEFPSDYDGVLYIKFGNGQWKLVLARELKAASYEVDSDALLQ